MGKELWLSWFSSDVLLVGLFYLSSVGANSVDCGYPKVNSGATLVWMLSWLQGEVVGELWGQ